MRIANNIMAMNTHHSYVRNNTNVSASAEKLSSGYRINRSADDAAGLAISEKVRAQIRGLNMAARNSQDAISLIQTAEGALEEVHFMLQRMNELAVQSATGTNETFDREQIAKEFEQLKREINDVSTSTKFNNMNVLDGSLSARGLQRSAYTSGIYTQFETIDAEAASGGVKQKTITEGTPFVKGYGASFTLDLTGIELEGGVAWSTTYLTVGGTEIDIGLYASSSTAADIASGITAAYAAGTANRLAIGGNQYYAEADGNKVTWVLDGGTDGEDWVDISQDTLDGYKITGLRSVNPAVTPVLPTQKDVVASAAGKANVDATIAESSFVYDWEAAKSGDRFKIGSHTFEFYNSDEGDPANTVNGIDLAQVTSASSLASVLRGYIGNGGTLLGGTEDEVNVAVSGNRIKIGYAGTAGSVQTNNTFGSGPYGTRGNGHVKLDSMPLNKVEEGATTFEIDTAKLKTGDIISWKSDDGATYEYTVTDKTTAKDIAAAFGLEIDGNSWKVEGRFDASDRIGFQAAADFKEYDMMRIQVGALEGEQLSIRIDAMNTAGLELDGHNIYTQEDAGAAITAVRDAVNQVSDQRALLGAMQNRMTYKISTLNISVENLQAAESRIRDVDIASEMTNFTKSNILSQAATAMLAQANSLPQNVLSLLR